MVFLAQSTGGFPRELLGLGLMVVAVVALLFVFNPRRKRKDPLDAPASTVSLQQQRSVERSIERLMVELTETSRQLTAELETRATKLRLLMEDADATLARLRDYKPPAATDAVEDLARRVQVAASSHAAPPPPAPAAEAEPPRRNSWPEPSPNVQRIYDLADEGVPLAEIAQRINRPSGEVELVLALRPRD